jgi:hypothetical protein
LTKKIRATSERSVNDTDYTTFLKHFGKFKVAKLDEKEVSGFDFLAEQISQLRREMRQFNRPKSGMRVKPIINPGSLNACMRGLSSSQVNDAASIANDFPGILSVRMVERSIGHHHLLIKGKKDADMTKLADIIYSDFNPESSDTEGLG